MDEVTHSYKDGESERSPQVAGQPDGSSSPSQSPSFLSVAVRWHPSQLVFRPYTPVVAAGAKPQTLRVVVRRPVSVIFFGSKLVMIVLNLCLLTY